jgi:uncharacterized protein YaeQ
VALTATIYNFDIDLADTDRGVYETLALRVARHPSESEEFLVTRVLAFCLEYTEGLEFSTGLSTPDEPAMRVRDMTGAWRAWIEVGTPDADRLHRAAKLAPRVAVYVHKDPTQYAARLAGARVHRAGEMEIWAMDRRLIEELRARLDRRMNMSVSISDHELLVSIGSETFSGALSRVPLG